jgi:hypothetical protein
VFNEECGYKCEHEDAKVNLGVKGGIKASSLVLWQKN